jgi:predicted dehydrogenase
MTSSPDNLRIAIIGAGFISDYHVNGLRAAGGAEITTLVGRSREKTAQRAADLGIAHAAIDYRAVLADSDIDAVVIATPDATHKSLAIDALQAGKPVLLQKPMAMTSQDCAQIIAVSEETGTRLTVSFMHRYFPEVLWLRQQIANRTYGKIHAIRMRNATPGADWAEWFFDPANVAGGVVMQLGVHGIDLVQHLFGPITDVSAISSTMKPDRQLTNGRVVISKLEDNTLASYTFADGFNASHEMSFTEVAGCDRFRLEVYFEKASVWLRTDRGPAAVIEEGDDQWRVVDLADQPLGKAHHAHWLDVARNAAPADDTAGAGLSTVVIAETIYRAVRERRTLALA